MSEISQTPEQELGDRFLGELRDYATSIEPDFGVRTVTVRETTRERSPGGEVQTYTFDARSKYVADQLRMRIWYSLGSRLVVPVSQQDILILHDVVGAPRQLHRHLGNIAGQNMVVEWQYEMSEDDEEVRATSGMYFEHPDDPGSNGYIDLRLAAGMTDGQRLNGSETDLLLDSEASTQALRISEALQGLGWYQPEDSLVLNTLQ